MGKYVKGRTSATTPTTEPGGPGDTDFMDGYPALWEYLTLSAWEDGSPRALSTLIVFQEDGAWKVCLNDRAEGRSLWRSADTLAGLWEALEVALAGNAADWRRSPTTGRRKK